MLVDDQVGFTKALSFLISDHNILNTLFHSPHPALDAINQQRSFSIGNVITHVDDPKKEAFSTAILNISIREAHKLIYNENRFSTVTIVLVDYAMLGMNGIEFCHKIKNKNIKKILLSGRADEKMAVEAFNNGIIDGFIRKGDRDMTLNVLNAIKKYQLEFFKNLTKAEEEILKNITLPYYLNEAQFVDVVNQVIKENSIVEYYYYELSGSLLMFDGAGRASLLIVKNDEDLDFAAEYLSENNVSKDIVKKVLEGALIPFFWEPRNYLISEKHTKGCLYPAKSLKNIYGNYYYAYAKLPLLKNLNHKDILSFNAYRDKVDGSLI